MHQPPQRLTVGLSVYRRLDNRSEGLSDDSPRAVELHIRRKEALHEALLADGWTVEEWGDTDDKQPHELVELVVGIAANPHVQMAIVSAATWAALELVKGVLGEFAAEAVKALLGRLVPKQEEKKILDFTITLPNGMTIKVDPNSQVNISSA